MTLILNNMTPKHYDNQQQYDVIDIIKDYDLNFNEGNAVKYIVRARRKGAHLEDLRKAMHYLDREIIHHETKLKFKQWEQARKYTKVSRCQ